jgi:hypothetical protein
LIRQCTARIVSDVRERLTRRPGGQGVVGSNPAVPTDVLKPLSRTKVLDSGFFH